MQKDMYVLEELFKNIKKECNLLELRITLNIVLGYILGIIMGLYCKISIVFFYMIIFSIFQVTHFLKRRSNYIEKRKFKIFSLRRYSRYLKIIFTKRVIIIIVISSIIANRKS